MVADGVGRPFPGPVKPAKTPGAQRLRTEPHLAEACPCVGLRRPAGRQNFTPGLLDRRGKDSRSIAADTDKKLGAIAKDGVFRVFQLDRGWRGG